MYYSQPRASTVNAMAGVNINQLQQPSTYTNNVYRAPAVVPQVNGGYSYGREKEVVQQVPHLQRHLYAFVSSSLGGIEEYVVQLEEENYRLKQKMLTSIRPALVCLFASQDGMALSAVLGAWKRFWEERKLAQLDDHWDMVKRQSRLDSTQKIDELEERLAEEESKAKALRNQIEQASKYAQDLEAEKDSIATKGKSLRSQIEEADKCVKVLNAETESALDVVRSDFKKYQRIAKESDEIDKLDGATSDRPGPRGELSTIKERLDVLASRVAASPSVPALGSTAPVKQLQRPPYPPPMPAPGLGPFPTPPAPPPPAPPGSDHDTASQPGGSLQASTNLPNVYSVQRQPSPMLYQRSVPAFPPADQPYPTELQPAGSMVVEPQGMIQVAPQQRLTPGPVSSMAPGQQTATPSPVPSPLMNYGAGRQPFVETRQAVPRLYLGT